MKHSKFKIILAILAIAVAVGLFIWRPWSSGPPDDFFRLQRVAKSQLRMAVSATGTLNPVRLVNVGTQVSGTIRELKVDFNDTVKAGDLMVVLDDDLFQAKVSMARANVKTAEAQCRLARIKYDRLVKLKQAGATPQEELDTAKANLDIAEAGLEQQVASLNQDIYNLNNTKILAPIDGVVVNRAVDVGQTVAASFQTPTLIDIAGDLTQMQINASFAEADIGRLKPGLLASFTVDAYPGQTFKGILRQIRLNPTNTSNVVTYDVVVDVSNPDGRLLPGMTAYVDIELYREDDVLLVPNTALNYRPFQGAADSGGQGALMAAQTAVADSTNPENAPTEGQVFVMDANGRPRPVKLHLGATDLRSTVVKSGDLKPGDMVVVGENEKAEAERNLFSRPGGNRGGRGGPGGPPPPGRF
ncbi:MAG: efflux RND transporter periplasmic adaptor subunit [Deltaproteobacteria bacterium]|jgi:HlyD family secretion protein|nr:efflux RND transporter periplasmic adaptor subunit [Deltaproteobacteria bacterium]